MREAAIQWVSHHGYAGIFSLLVLGIVGVPIPDEWLLTLAGFLVYKGTLAFAPTLASAFLGTVCGITLSFLLGRYFGTFLLVRYGARFGITHEEVARVHGWFKRVGRWAISFGYFVPGVRHLTAYVAGATELEFPVFAAYAYSGGLIWTLTFILAGYFLGEKWSDILEAVHGTGVLITIVISAGLVYFYFRRRRRLAAGSSK